MGSKQANKVPVKLSTVVVESVKYMQEVYNKEGQDGRKELDKLEFAVHGLKEKIQEDGSNYIDIIEDLTNLETVLAEYKSLCKEVAFKKEENKLRLSRLRERMQRSTFSKTKIEEVIRRFSQEETDVLTEDKRSEANDRRHSKFSPSRRRKVLANSLPSIRRLPTLPLLTATAPGDVRPQQGGVIGCREGTLDHGRRTIRIRKFWDMEE